MCIYDIRVCIYIYIYIYIYTHIKKLRGGSRRRVSVAKTRGENEVSPAFVVRGVRQVAVVVVVVVILLLLPLLLLLIVYNSQV